MATLKATQIITLARKKILENSTAIFADEDLLLYANLAKDEIALRVLSPDLVTPAVLSFVNGIVTKPTDFASHYLSKTSLTPGVGDVFNWVNLEDFRAGKYDNMITLYNGNLMVFPVNTSTVYMDYYKKLVDMTNNSDCPLDAALGLATAYKTAALAFQDLQDVDLAEYYEKKFEIEFGIKSQALSYATEQSQESGDLLNPISIL